MLRKDIKKRILLELSQYRNKEGVHLANLRSIPKSWSMTQWAKAMDELAKEGLIRYTGYGRHKKVSGKITRKGRKFLKEEC